nr:hypothetical protein [Kitasatospora arboriphila]
MTGAPKCARAVAKHVQDGVPIGDICLHGQASAGPQFVGERVGGRLAAVEVDDHPRALESERPGDGGAESTGPAGHQDDLLGQWPVIRIVPGRN